MAVQVPPPDTTRAALTAALLLAMAFPGRALAAHLANPARGAVKELAPPVSGAAFFRRSTFWMGSDALGVVSASARCAREPFGAACRESFFAVELDLHRVTLDAFELDRTEVTLGAYLRCVELGACSRPPYERGARRFARRELPVVLVSWSDAQRYCAWRGARLPSEAEWERAARGRTAREFPWGELYHPARANHGRLALDSTDARDGFKELAPVASFPSGRTPEGVYDLAGNVSEWTEDSFEPNHAPGPVDNPRFTAPSASGLRVVKGGDFGTGAPWLRGASRRGVDPGRRSPTIGFRCARSIGPP